MTQPQTTRKSRFRNDVILICVLLFVSLLGMLYLFVFREGGDTVKITVDGELYGIYSLTEEVTEEIRTGEGYNRLVIHEGRAYMESANCPDGICVEHRPIFRSGESIVCLPNRVVISVIADNDSDTPDIVA